MKTSFFKKICLMLAIILVFGMLLPLGQVNVEAKAKVKLNRKNLTMNTGDWKKLKLKNLNYEIELTEHIGNIRAEIEKLTAEIKNYGFQRTCSHVYSHYCFFIGHMTSSFPEKHIHFVSCSKESLSCRFATFHP